MAERQRRTRDVRLTVRVPEWLEESIREVRQEAPWMSKSSAVLWLLETPADAVSAALKALGPRSAPTAKPVRLTEEDRQVLDKVAAAVSAQGNQTRRLGGLVNQLAARANSGGNVDAAALRGVVVELAELRAQVEALRDELAGAATWRN